MTSRGVVSKLRQRLEIRSGEGIAVGGLLAYFFIVMAAGYIILALKVTGFLTQLPAVELPLVFLATAAAMSVVASVNARFLQKLRPRRYIRSSLVFFVAGLVAFWWLKGLIPLPRWLPYVFWFWSEMFLAISVSQFWILANDVFPPRRFKRFVGLFIAGGLLGGIAGSVVARFVKDRLLYILCGIFLLLALFLLRRLPASVSDDSAAAPGTRRPSGRKPAGYLESLKTVLKNRYLLFLSGMMLASFATSQVINFQFLALLQHSRPEAEIKPYVTAFYSGLLVASTLVNLLVTSRLLRRLGLKGALFVSPAVLAGGVTAGWLVPAGGLLAWATVLRGADKSLSHTLSQSTREILYIPVAAETRYKAKVFIDLFVNKFADALAAFLLFLTATVLKLPTRTLSVLTLGFILAWCVLNRRILVEYVGIVKKNLAISRPDADQLILDRIDVDATKLVFDTLESRQRSSVLYAMNLLDLVGKDKLTPELRAIIAAKSAEVRAGSFDSLLDVSGERLFPDWEDALEDADMGKEVREVLSLDVYQTVMRDHVRKVASSRGDADAVAQMEVAKALGMMSGDAPLVGTLRGILKRGSPEVVRYALESAGRQARREFIPLILPHLGRPVTRETAAAALAESGDRFAGMLNDALRDMREDIQVRRAIPGVLARIATPRAAVLLAAGLVRDDESVLDETIEALFRLRTLRPETKFEEAEIGPAVLRLIRKLCALVLAVDQAERAAPRAVPAGDIESLLSKTVKQIFELLSLVHPREDIVRAYQNYHEGSKKSVDFALELLETILKKDMKDVLLPLLEESPAAEKARVARRVLKALER